MLVPYVRRIFAPSRRMAWTKVDVVPFLRRELMISEVTCGVDIVATGQGNLLGVSYLLAT